MDIFSYLDHRHCLLDLYQQRKRNNRWFSHRYISRRLHVKSSAVFSQILKGTCNVSETMIPRLASVFGFDVLEAAYFNSMVHYCQAQNRWEKEYFSAEMDSMRSLKARKVPLKQFEFYRQWYYSAVWAVIRLRPFSGDYRELAHSLIPPITRAQAKKSVELLKKLGFIYQDKNGVYHQNDSMITTGNDVRSAAIRDYHRQTLLLAGRAITAVPRSKRQISTVTLGISKKGLDEAMEIIGKCRKRLMSLAERERSPDMVYQLNFQVFPLCICKKNRRVGDRCQRRNARGAADTGIR
jgi:uncharacterized protein (TIGR02147 family)